MPTLSHRTASGRRVRTSSQHRYVTFYSQVDGRQQVYRRTDNRSTAITNHEWARQRLNHRDEHAITVDFGVSPTVTVLEHVWTGDRIERLV